MASFKERLIGVLTVDAEAFEEIEHDKSATTQAAVVVVVAALLSAIGGSGLVSNMASGFVAVFLWAIVSWLLWSAITYIIGTKIFNGDADFGQMLRVVGFAFAPSAFHVFSFIPLIGLLISFLVSFWLLATVFIGVRAGLDLDNGKILVVVLIGWFVYLIGLGVVGALVGFVGI